MGKFIPAVGTLPLNTKLFARDIIPSGEYFATVRAKLSDMYGMWDWDTILQAFVERGVDYLKTPDPIAQAAVACIKEFDAEQAELECLALTPEIARTIIDQVGTKEFHSAEEDYFYYFNPYDLVQITSQECADFYNSLTPLEIEVGAGSGAKGAVTRGVKTRAAAKGGNRDIYDEDPELPDVETPEYDETYYTVVPADEYPFVLHVHVD